jgi:hypothetical protein
MALTEAEFDRIEAYLDGNLSADEHRQLEAEMAGDRDLQQAVEEHRVIWEGLQVPVATAYFQEMHEQLEDLGLLFDDLWVEADSSDDTAVEHHPHPTAHHSDHDEPEVYVTAEPKTDLDDHTTHIEVAVHDELNLDIHTDPELDDKPDGWDGPTDTDLPDTHHNDPDEY